MIDNNTTISSTLSVGMSVYNKYKGEMTIKSFQEATFLAIDNQGNNYEFTLN